MIFTFLAGIVGFRAFLQSKTCSEKSYFRTTLLMIFISILEAIISLAWENTGVGNPPRGLWFLALLTAFPLSTFIDFYAPFLELGFFRLQISLGSLPIAYFISPSTGYRTLNGLYWAITIRAMAFPILFLFNLLMVPIVFLLIRMVKRLTRGAYSV